MGISRENGGLPMLDAAP